jgi:hypothetical protein
MSTANDTLIDQPTKPGSSRRKEPMKAEMIQSLSTALNATALWRTGLDSKWPDRRNARAARNLLKLPGEAASLTDEQFAALDFESDRWNECLRKASRQIGFFYRKASLAFFLRNLIRLLDEPATAT